MPTSSTFPTLGATQERVPSHGMCHALDAKVGKGTFTQHFGLGRPLQPWTLSSSVCIPQRMLDDQMFHGALIMSRSCLDIRDGVPPAAM